MNNFQPAKNENTIDLAIKAVKKDYTTFIDFLLGTF
jgi:hypothetical protein